MKDSQDKNKIANCQLAWTISNLKISGVHTYFCNGCYYCSYHFGPWIDARK